MSRPHLRPAFLLIALGALWILGAWTLGDIIRQYRVLQTLAATLLTLVGLVLWLAFFSRWPGRVRLYGAAAVLLVVGLLASLVRIRGVSGDLRPIVGFRWARPEPPPLPKTSPPTTVPAMAPNARETDPLVKPRTAPPTAPRPPAPAVADSPAWPQFLGPTRDATLAGPRLARDWTKQPPRLVWRQAIGPAWSSFAIEAGLAVTQEQRGPQELVVAYELATGRVRWSHADLARYETMVAGIGPRATPAIGDGRVFAQGATGILNALDRDTGRLLWSRQVVEENGARPPGWGKSASPLVYEGKVIVSAGGSEGRSLVAYGAATGERIWAGGHDGSSYSSPQLVSLRGRPQVVILNRGSVAGHDPATGALLWEHPWPSDQPSVAQPLALGGERVLFSAGYGIGSKLFSFAGEETDPLPALVWESPRLKSKITNLVLHDGFVYGLDDGVLTCLDPATGERRWKAGRYGHGQILLVDGLLLVQTEEGEGVLVEAVPDAHRELTRFPLLEGKTWNPPALSGSRLLVRNDREAALYALPVVE